MGSKSAGAAFGCGIVGLPLFVLSYAWLPFVWAGREMGSAIYAVVLGEVGALAAGTLAIGLGIAARRSLEPAHPRRRLATWALAMGALVLVLVLVPNIVGNLLPAR